jgi:Cysteine rich repeat
MITLRRAAALSPLLAATTFAVITPAFPQAPTEAQRSAIRSECRADYEAHCASIPPGGAASLECLQKNMSSLAPGCQSAVRAVEVPSESKTETKVEPQSEPKSETKTNSKTEPEPAAKEAGAPAKQPSSAQIAAIRSACRSDYPKICAGVPTGGAPALQCLEKNKSKVSAGCQKAVAAADGGAPATAATASRAAAPAGAAAAPAVLMLRPLRPREVLFVMRSACGGDVRALCPGVEPGGGRIVECLATQAASLSPACREVLAPFAAR